MKAKKDQKPKMLYKYSPEKYNTYEEEVFDQSIDFIKRNAKSDKPFYLYVGGKANHFFGAHPDFMDTPAQTNTAAPVYQALPERPYDPEPTLKYETKKQVDW